MQRVGIVAAFSHRVTPLNRVYTCSCDTNKAPFVLKFSVRFQLLIKLLQHETEVSQDQDTPCFKCVDSHLFRSFYLLCSACFILRITLLEAFLLILQSFVDYSKFLVSDSVYMDILTGSPGSSPEAFTMTPDHYFQDHNEIFLRLFPIMHLVEQR